MMARGHVRGGRAPQFLTFGLLIVICVLAFNYWNVSSKSKILQKQVQEMTSTLEELAMKKIHLEKRSEALQTQITETNRKTMDLRGEKDKCGIDLSNIQLTTKELTESLDGCEERRLFFEKSLDVQSENASITVQLLNECTRKLSIAVEEEDLINDKQREEVHQQNEEIIQLTANKEELAGNLQKCEEEKDEVMNLAKNFKTQAATAQRDFLQCKEGNLQCQNQLQQLMQQQQAVQQQPGMQQQQQQQYQQQQLPLNQGIGNQQYVPVDQQQQYVQQPNDLQQQQQQPIDVQQQQQQQQQQVEYGAANQQYIQQMKQKLEQQMLLQQQQLQQQQQAQQMNQGEAVIPQQNDNERGVPLEVGDNKVVEQGQQDPGLPEREANEVNQPVEVEGEGKDETLHQEENNAREEGGEEDGGPAYRDEQGEVEDENKAMEEKELEAKRLEIEEQRLAEGREEDPQDGGDEREDIHVEEGDRERDDAEERDGAERDGGPADQEGPREYGDDDRDTEEQAEGANVPVVDQDTDVEDNEHGNENNRDAYPDHGDISNKSKENQEGQKEDAQGHYGDGEEPAENRDEDEHAKDVYGGEENVEDADQDHV